MTLLRTISLVVGSAALLAACTSPNESATETGGNTSWLEVCSQDDECGAEGVCFGGLCSTRCSDVDSCSAHAGAVCFSPGTSLSCTSPALCLPSCQETTDCAMSSPMLECIDSVCVPTTCSAEPETSESETEPEQQDSSGTETEPASDATPSTTADATTDTDNTTEETTSPSPATDDEETTTTALPSSDELVATAADAGPSASETAPPLEQSDGQALVTELLSDEPRNPPDADPNNSGAQDERNFTWSFYAGTLDPEQNMVFSPYSISTAFAMLVAGAAGDTESEIRDVMHFSSNGAEFNQAQNTILQALQTREHEETETRHAQVLTWNNDLWLNNGFEVEPLFVDTLGQSFGAPVRFVPFATEPELSRRTINAKVSDDTHALVPELIPPGQVTELTRFAISNAIYLKAHWAHPFPKDATDTATFAGVSTDVDVPMMHGQATQLGYVKTNAYEAVAVPFENSELEFVALMPAEGEFEDFALELSEATVAEALAALETTEVLLNMPRFELHQPVPLKEKLMDLGMLSAFELATADFSLLSTTPMYVTGVFHDAHVIVDEDGVEAAGATVIIGGPGAGPPEPTATVTLDRPFVFFIRDVQSNVNLFAGHYAQP